MQSGCFFLDWMERSGTWLLALLGERGHAFFNLFDPLRASGPKASLLAKEGACLVLWVGSGFSPWAPIAVGDKSEP